MSNSGKTFVIPQWQGGGQDLCTYYGAYSMLNNYLDGRADAVIEIGTGPISPAKEGILGYDDILEGMRRACEAFALQKPEKIFTIGGGCDADTPCAAWLNEVYDGDMAVVYVDSHGDLNTPASSESHLYYGMSLRALAGESDPKIVSLLHRPITPNQLVTCGHRNLDPEEIRYKKEHAIPDFSVVELERHPEAAAEAVIAKGFHNAYIHIDFDVLDRKEFALTPLEEPDGMTKETLLRIVRAIGEKVNIVGFGLLEYSGGAEDRDDPFLEKLIAFGKEHICE